MRRKAKTETGAVSKPTGALSPDEVAHWLKEFGGLPSPSTDSDYPFPPGYGDDVAEEG
jgi:hypothetical protein